MLLGIIQTRQDVFSTGVIYLIQIKTLDTIRSNTTLEFNLFVFNTRKNDTLFTSLTWHWLISIITIYPKSAKNTFI